jgi:acyl-CoA thioesterase FadM
METWLRPIRDLRDELAWDMMLKRFTIEWSGSLASGDLLDIEVAVTRWGRTSFDLGYLGRCEGREVFRAWVVYVSVELGALAPMETPVPIRDFMGDAVDLMGIDGA